ncbi:MAG: hypothetical protein KDA42_01100 [Planctomycetales bacterium]|nr:hypothetical protein [Planctomycetales bacterium]
MSFDGVDLTPLPFEIDYHGNASVTAWLQFFRAGESQLHCADLKAAKGLKELFLRQEIRIQGIVKPVLLRWEHPVMIGASTSLLSASDRLHELPLCQRLFDIATGKDSAADLDWHAEEVVEDESSNRVTRNGVRFSYMLLIVDFKVVDEKGNAVPGVSVISRNNP